MKKTEFVVALEGEESIRLDKYIASLGIGSRSQIRSYKMRAWSVEKEREISLATKVRDGQTFTIEWEVPSTLVIKGEEMALEILFEDENVLVLNKSQGVVVHPANGHERGTLIQGVLSYLEEHRENFPDEEIRPGVVHRLDKETTGVMMVAKNQKSLDFLSAQFERHEVKKEYLALVKGTPPTGLNRIESCLRRNPGNRKKFEAHETIGRVAVTDLRVLKRWDNYSLLRLFPQTGRTHQLRVHLLSKNCPILGDPVYSRKESAFPEARLHLHAFRLSFNLPFGDEILTVTQPLPPPFVETLKTLNGTL